MQAPRPESEPALVKNLNQHWLRILASPGFFLLQRVPLDI